MAGPDQGWEETNARIRARNAPIGAELYVGETMYWGVWHLDGGWLVSESGILFYTRSKDVAQTQLDVSSELRRFQHLEPDRWEVRQIGGQGG